MYWGQIFIISKCSENLLGKNDGSKPSGCFSILMMYLIRTTKNWSNNHRVFTDCTDFSQNLNAGSKTTQCPQVNGPNHEVKRVSRGFFQQDSAKVMSEIEGKCEI